jgi:hypothetical protein
MTRLWREDAVESTGVAVEGWVQSSSTVLVQNFIQKKYNKFQR